MSQALFVGKPGETAVFINDHYIIMKLIFIQYRDDRSVFFKVLLLIRNYWHTNFTKPKHYLFKVMVISMSAFGLKYNLRKLLRCLETHLSCLFIKFSGY